MKLLASTIIATVSILIITSGHSQASIVVRDNIDTLFDENGNSIGTSVDYWHFTVNSIGPVSIDVLAWEGVNGRGATTGFVDINGDGELTFVDSAIRLFIDDGSLDAGDHIAFNDDSANTFGDGSIRTTDPFLSLTLVPGDYLLAIGVFGFELSDALAGINPVSRSLQTFQGGVVNDSDHADYQITFSGDLTVTSGPNGRIIAAPEPATLALFSFGLVSLFLLRWWRRDVEKAPRI